MGAIFLCGRCSFTCDFDGRLDTCPHCGGPIHESLLEPALRPDRPLADLARVGDLAGELARQHSARLAAGKRLTSTGKLRGGKRRRV